MTMARRFLMSVGLAAALLVAPAFHRSALPGTPAFVHGSLVCQINTNRWLRANGYNDTGSPAARSVLRWRHVSRENAAFGDVHFNWRKGRPGAGHSQIVAGRRGGRLMCLNPSAARQAWVLKTCPAGGIFVRPGKSGSGKGRTARQRGR